MRNRKEAPAPRLLVVDEVLARIRAVLKRTRPAAGSRLQVADLGRQADQGEPRLIHTIRGVGYVLRIPPP
jgi:DNA-binding response OmpR family regulator